MFPKEFVAKTAAQTRILHPGSYRYAVPVAMFLVPWQYVFRGLSVVEQPGRAGCLMVAGELEAMAMLLEEN